ncbi:hypothetical protein [Roseateles amylovorans]|uniref:Uncharacterized protein n=1 Tax=Roseateles amylovorans TaxID=2978473 RepID=A0ABY6B3M9_9BURK|nr:hypothetical protein [Roseateles amylovorans]UXH78589.1 hypothetical protein N4261_01220 [Roseateles amylovorans]
MNTSLAEGLLPWKSLPRGSCAVLGPQGTFVTAPQASGARGPQGRIEE